MVFKYISLFPIVLFFLVDTAVADTTSSRWQNFNGYSRMPRSGTATSSSSSQQAVEAIAGIARSNEGCLNHNFPQRGRVQQFRGAFFGLAVSMARSVCRNDDDVARQAMLNGANGNSDALNYYNLDTSNERSAFANTYSLLFSHIARESTGRFWSGVDVTAASSMNNAEQAEAGLCQASYNINMYFPSGREGREAILAQYRENQNLCLTNLFSEGEGGSVQGQMNVPDLTRLTHVSSSSQAGGSESDSVAYQNLMRTCPAAAAEFCAISIRHVRRHFGPLTRREAQPVASCTQTFSQVYDYVATHRESVCPGLLDSPSVPAPVPVRNRNESIAL